MKTASQILSFTKNETTNQWEFMILNVEPSNKGAKVDLGPFSIDYGLQCLTVVNNQDQILKTIDLRKFKNLTEFKINQRVDGF